MDILDKSRVLKLDKNWRPFNTTSIRKAFLDASAGAATLLRFHDGNPTPYRMEDWINIPVGDKEEYITIGGKYHGEIRKVAIPRVIICVGFDQFILEKQNFKKSKPITTRNVAERDHFICAVSHKKLQLQECSVEHVRPRSKGGKHEWTNVRLMDRKLNSLRGNKSYRKIGYRKPKSKPAPIQESFKLINKWQFPEWDLFRIPRK